jgi:hypothetical protein
MSIGDKMIREYLFKCIRESWSEDTSYKNIWTKECPELNQCAVTAMLIQDYFGGDLLRCKCSDGSSHYWNRLSDGEMIDLTIKQFKYSGIKPYKDKFMVRDRKVLNRYKDTYRRYLKLKEEMLKVYIYG